MSRSSAWPIGWMTLVVAWSAGGLVSAIGQVARADEEDGHAPRARARGRTESLTLVDTIDFNRWRPDTLAVSPDGMRIAYATLDGQGRGHIVVDGKAGLDYTALAGVPVFSADSRHVAYAARNTQNQWFAVVDGVERRDKYPSVKGHPGISTELLFSLDGRRLAYVASVDTGSAVKQFVVVDGQEGAQYEEIAGLAMSPNGERVAHAARTGNRWAVVVDGREEPRHEGVLGQTPVFSPDGRHVAYAARDGGRFFVVVDRKRGRDYDGMGGAIFFAPDSARVVYSPAVGRRRAVVVGEEELGLYERIDDYSFAFSPDGRHLAYKAGDANSWFVVVDGKRGGSYAGVGRPAFTPDGRVVYTACDRCGGGPREDAAVFVVLDGKKIGAAYAGIAEPIAFSADGRRMAFVAKRGPAQLVVVDGKEERTYASVAPESLVFSPTGRDLVYVAAKDATRRVVVVSGVEGRELDTVGPRGFERNLFPETWLLFDSDRSLRYLAILRDRVYLVRNWAEQ